MYVRGMGSCDPTDPTCTTGSETPDQIMADLTANNAMLAANQNAALAQLNSGGSAIASAPWSLPATIAGIPTTQLLWGAGIITVAMAFMHRGRR